MITRSVAIVGGELLVLPQAIEVRVLELTIEEFSNNACMKLDILGCHKTNCFGNFFFFIHKLINYQILFKIDKW